MEAEPTSLGRILRVLENDPRVGGAQVVVAGRVVEIHRAGALALIVRGSDLGGDALMPYAERLAGQRAGILLVGEAAREAYEALPERVLAGLLPEAADGEMLYHALAGLLDRVELRQQDQVKSMSLDRARYELGELIEIGKALTQERDIDKLLDQILNKSRFVTGADAGSIYVVEDVDEDGERQQLHFMTSQNDSCDFESSDFSIPIDPNSIAGYAAVTRRPINIPDVHDIPEDAPYGYDESFDNRVGYRTCSMIAVPMISAEDEVIGVIQLINKKKVPSGKLVTPEDYAREVIPFDERSAEMLTVLASQAGVALENALLYEEIKQIFEGFVRASVQAIEQRDPTTSGHSLRVSVLSCRLAETLERVDTGPYREASFTPREVKELEYASLLHDFGKIGVREPVLVKAKKLYPHDLESIRQRVFYALKANEADGLRRKIALMEAGAGKGDLERVDAQVAARREELESAFRTITEANEPTVLSEGDFTRISEIARITYVDGEGLEKNLLSPVEVESLQVRRGSLNDAEMSEVRSHVVHTFNFLRRIPWGRSFARIPVIAGAHHEKLDGSGYPDGITAEVIPLQSKIMTIADIFDALTARDRPYKKAMPVERALDILGYEVEGGQVDGELVRIFHDARIYDGVDTGLSY